MTVRTAISLGAGMLAGTCLGYLLWSNGIGIRWFTTSPSSSAVASADGALHHLEPGEAFRDSVFQTTVASTPEMALEDLGALPAGSGWMVIALGLVDALGNNAEAIERVASFLPYARAQGLRVKAVENIAQSDVRSAIAYALTLDPPTVQSAALQRVAGVAAASDPRIALDHVLLVPYGSRRTLYTQTVLGTWTHSDPGGVLDYLDRIDLSETALPFEALSVLVSAEPERLLAIMHGLPPDVVASFEQAALGALLESDPSSAYAYASALPPGRDRDRLLLMIARNHSQLDAKGALSHILAVHRPPAGAVNGALARVAAEDFSYALEMAAESLVSGQASPAVEGTLFQLLSTALQHATPDVAAAVEFIANHHHHSVRRQLNGVTPEWSVLGTWAQHDPDGAVAWAARNPSLVDPAVVEHLGTLLAAASSDRAAEALYDLPAELRGYWVAGVAKGLATSSLEAALEWLEPMAGAPVYTTALEGVLNTAGSGEPAAVARIIDSMPEARPSLVLTVARQWALREPDVAGDWLVDNQGLDAEIRAQLLGDVVLGWAGRDLHGAERWTRNLPEGSVRDSALGAVIRAAAESGSVDVRLLAEFSSEGTRARSLVGAMDAFRLSDPELGRWLIDEYIFDPELRGIAQQRLEGQDRAPIRYIDGVRVR